MLDGQDETSKVIGVVACDFLRAGIGTRSRLMEMFGGERVVERMVGRLARVEGVEEIVLLVPAEQMGMVEGLGLERISERVRVRELVRRAGNIEACVKAGRAWGLSAWRGGAGQWTCFDEEYHPAGVGGACAEFGAKHVLVVNSHAGLLDAKLTSGLVQHHLHKNHEMRMTYTASAPGLSGMVIQGEMAREMGEKGVMPWQLLAYDPKKPAFDTLIRDACMQVDPALSKIPNRFCLDTDRSWAVGEWLLAQGEFGSAAEMATAAARVTGPGVRSVKEAHGMPREVEVELTGRRETRAPGSVPKMLREGRGELDAGHWERWWGRQVVVDDLCVTVGGDGDPVLYAGLGRVLRAVRRAGVLSVCVQTDLAAEEVEGLLECVREGLVDVISITTYGHTAETYARVAGADLFGRLRGNLEKLGAVARECGGMPLVVPRLLKVRETIPEMEAFFDLWVQQSGWGVIEGPTDRAGEVAFAGVVEMGPPKRKSCRRLWERMLIRANGNAVACDQDVHDRLVLGNIEGAGVGELWRGVRMEELRVKHEAGAWGEILPCRNCREWYRA